MILDSDLAFLYDVQTSALNRAVKRNLDRFPADFMFQLNEKELKGLRCQIGISKKSRGGRRYSPYAFTEQGVAMLSSVLNSSRAIQVNILIMRAFVRFRQMISQSKELSEKIEQIEKKTMIHDKEIQTLFSAIRQLMTPPELPRRKIGFSKD